MVMMVGMVGMIVIVIAGDGRGNNDGDESCDDGEM